MENTYITSEDIIRAGRAVLPKLPGLVHVAAPAIRVQILGILEELHSLSQTFHNLSPQPGQREKREERLEKKCRAGVELTGLEKKYAQLMNKQKMQLVQLNLVLRTYPGIWKWVETYFTKQKLSRVS